MQYSKKSKIKTNFRKVLQWHNCLNSYIQPVHKIIHFLYLMNFFILLTSNLLIRLQMICNWGGGAAIIMKLMKKHE